MKPLDYNLLKKRPLVVYIERIRTADTPYERRIIGSSRLCADEDVNNYLAKQIAKGNKILDEYVEQMAKAHEKLDEKLN